MSQTPKVRPTKGRGAPSNEDARFLDWTRVRDDSGAPGPLPRTTLTDEWARSIITKNQSPDIPFDRSINPYRGCEHGCVYCYARPTHAYLGLSPGLDFESRLVAKKNAAQVLERTLRTPGYEPSVIALGANTDPYQPVERRLGITREILKVLSAFGHPVMITTKSALVGRDLDLLADMAQRKLVLVSLSIATLDRAVARTLEPRASAPHRRMETIQRLARAGIPSAVIVAPVTPALTDDRMEDVLAQAVQAGARHAHYVLLRLPLEVRDLFCQWLNCHYPDRTEHVMSLVRQSHSGRDYESAFGVRMRGQGLVADMIAQRFQLAARRPGLDRPTEALSLTEFRAPRATAGQMDLF